ncbi:DMT family transporter [Endozoicomonas ascidiicola]|uniref:DMT family transporter n=1 Tax=Endozoicomonas ascidiicola TaxID=1698521 RepID=UPI0008353E78|nr:DMT family transporter [Endozoicomonas ascidiicola]
MQSTSNLSLKADFVLLFVGVLAATGWLFSKFAIGGMPPMGYIAIRYIGAAAIIFPFAISQIFRLSSSQLLTCLVVGLLQTCAMYFWIQAVDNSTQLGEGAFIMSLSLTMVPFLIRLMFGTKINRLTLYALPFAVGGIALLAIKSSWQFEMAQLLYLTATLFFALHFIYTSRFSRDIPAMATTFMMLLVPGVISAGISYSVESWPVAIAPEFWWWVVAAVVLSTSLRYFLYTWALKHSEPSHAVLLMILEPVWTAVMSVIWLGEILTEQKVLGCVLILTALVISRWNVIKKPSTVQTAELLRE